MEPSEFDREFNRLRNHYGERHYSNEIKEVFLKEFRRLPASIFREVILECISTMPQVKPPLRDDIKEKLKELGHENNSSWKYFTIDDCIMCNGFGYHWAKTSDNKRGPMVCIACKAGENLRLQPVSDPKWKLPVFKEIKGHVWWDGPVMSHDGGEVKYEQRTNNQHA